MHRAWSFSSLSTAPRRLDPEADNTKELQVDDIPIELSLQWIRYPHMARRIKPAGWFNQG